MELTLWWQSHLVNILIQYLFLISQLCHVLLVAMPTSVGSRELISTQNDAVLNEEFYSIMAPVESVINQAMIHVSVSITAMLLYVVFQEVATIW